MARAAQIAAHTAAILALVATILLLTGAGTLLTTNRAAMNLVDAYNTQIATYQGNGAVNFTGLINVTLALSGPSSSASSAAPAAVCAGYLSAVTIANQLPDGVADTGAYSYADSYYSSPCAALSISSQPRVVNWQVTTANLNKPPMVQLLATGFGAAPTRANQTLVYPAAPLWQVNSRVLSSHNNIAAGKACTANGGYLQRSTDRAVCTTIYAVTGMCGKVAVAGPLAPQWTVSSTYGGPACAFPFNQVATYTQVPFSTGVANVSAANVTMTLVSDDDPSVYLSAVTNGNGTFAWAYTDSTKPGLVLVAVSIAFFVFTLAATVVACLLARDSATYQGTDSPVSVSYASLRQRALIYATIAVLVLAIAVGGGMPISFLENTQQIMNSDFLYGFWILILGIPTGLSFFFQAWRIVCASPQIPHVHKQLALVGSAAYLLVICIGLITEFILPWKCTANNGGGRFGGEEQGGCSDAFEMLWNGYSSTWVVIALGTAALWCLATALTMKTIRKSDYQELSTRLLDVVEDHENTTSGRMTMIGAALVIPLSFIAAMLLPPMFNTPVLGYASMTSQYSMAFVPLFGPVDNPMCDTGNTNYVNFKLYPDLIAFYGYVFFLCISAFIVSRSHTLRLWLSRRFPVHIPYVWSGFVAYGEALLGLSFLGLLIWWFCYWVLMYDRIAYYGGNIGYKPNVDPLGVCGGASDLIGTDDGTDRSTAKQCFTELANGPYAYYLWPQALARGFGHISNLLLTFTFFPVARNSMWEKMFGVSFERAIRYHRGLGICLVLSATLHLIFWVTFWAPQNALFNLLAVDGCNIIPYAGPHCDNFTIPVMLVIWVLMIVMAALAVDVIRRRHFEWFYYFHHVFVLIIVAAISHAFALWSYACGPLILWAMDRFIRLNRSCEAFSITSLSVKSAGVTTLVVRPAEGIFKHNPGQYCFINIPAISHMQWHPFSICSGASGRELKFHIKDMGPGTWTHTLSQLAHRHHGHTQMPIYIDGPYGSPIDVNQFESVLLFAGGIGVTPMHSILSGIHDRIVQHIDPSPKHAKLVWAVHQASMCEIVADSLSSMKQLNGGSSISVQLHASRANCDGNVVDGLPYVAGRPSLGNVMTGALLGVNNDPSKLVVLVCGPEAMVDAVSQLAHHHGVTFYAESFHL